jgi:SAM-dependent methyltransferase
MSRCGICGKDGLTPLFHAVDRNFRTSDEEFLVEQCPSCGVAQTTPRPDPSTAHRYYPPPYYPTRSDEQGEFEQRLLRLQNEKMRILHKYRSHGTLLDIGCGAGAFVRAASLAGFDAQGIEISDQAAEFGRRTWAITVQTGDLMDVEIPAESFDIITLWQVLEHLARPVETLRKARGLLREGGLLMLAVPNFDSFQARLFRNRWYHLEVPRHLFHYTPASLQSLLKQVGFRILAVHHHSAEHNWAGILGSLFQLTALSSSVAGRAFREFAGKPVAFVLAGMESRAGRGGTVVLCAEKSGP